MLVNGIITHQEQISKNVILCSMTLSKHQCTAEQYHFFWEIWTPKCCRWLCGPQKGTSLRHNRSCEPLCVKIHPWVTSVGEPGKKIKIKKKRPYISRISPGAPLRPTGTHFGLLVRLVDVINCAKFYRNRLRGSVSVRGQSLAIHIGLRCCC